MIFIAMLRAKVKAKSMEKWENHRHTVRKPISFHRPYRITEK